MDSQTSKIFISNAAVVFHPQADVAKKILDTVKWSLWNQRACWTAIFWLSQQSRYFLVLYFSFARLLSFCLPLLALKDPNKRKKNWICTKNLSTVGKLIVRYCNFPDDNSSVYEAGKFFTFEELDDFSSRFLQCATIFLHITLHIQLSMCDHLVALYWFQPYETRQIA